MIKVADLYPFPGGDEVDEHLFERRKQCSCGNDTFYVVYDAEGIGHQCSKCGQRDWTEYTDFE